MKPGGRRLPKKLNRSGGGEVSSPLVPAVAADSALARERHICELELEQTRLVVENEALRLARAALQSNRQYFSELFDLAPVGYLILDAAGKILEINEAGARFLGRDRAALMRSDFHRFVVDEDLPNFLQHLRQCKGTRSIVGLELCLRRREIQVPVELVSVSCGPAFASSGRFRTLIIDITKRRRAEAALLSTQQNYQRLINTIEGIVWEADARTGRFTFVSQQAERLLGFPAPRWLKGDAFWESHLHVDDRERVLSCRAQAILARQDYTLEYRMNTIDRRVLWLRERVTLREEGDAGLKLRGVIVDISDRKDAEAELVQMNDELEARIKQRTNDLTKTNAELQNQIEERRRLEKEMLDITERERMRIGQDLHDDLGQQLTGIALLAKSLEQKLTEKCLQEEKDAAKIQSLVNQTIHHARNLARHLTSGQMDADDLPAALKGLALHARSLFKVACTFRAHGAVPTLGQSTVRQLFNIAQEATTNAIKHGQASHILIHLGARPKHLVLTIRNDGLRFPAKQDAYEGLGMRFMAYRASVIGASLEIRADGKQGTIVTCALPVNEKSALEQNQPAPATGRKRAS